MKLSTIADAEAALQPFVAKASETTGRDITTERTYALARLVGNPQDDLRVIHIAGTSGKTSTAYYTAGLLGAQGIKVGLTVSPHISSIAERVQVNDDSLTESVFCDYLEQFLDIIPQSGDAMPSYFELMMVFALWVFAREKVDYAVVETGLGGLHDASNICRRADKLCIITDIGFDHMHVLGNTIEQIAFQKAGIIAPNNQVVMHEQAKPIVDVIQKQVTSCQATLEIITPKEYPSYQDRNFALACAAHGKLATRDRLPPLEPIKLKKVRNTTVPGRLETIDYKGIKIVRDGAHNEQKMCVLVETLQRQFPGKKWAIVLAMKESKDYEAVLGELAPITKRVEVTTFHLNQDTIIHAIDPKILAEECAKFNIPNRVSPDVHAALDRLINDGEADILVTGSLYLVAELG